MKKILSSLIICGLVIISTSCNKYLDVNTNPNSPTSSTPDLVLPQALVATGASMVTFNGYGAWIGGNQANAGGYGGFGSVFTYNYSTSDNTGLWTTSYDNINDYQYILNNTTATGDFKYFNAIARTMKCFNFVRLVDAYGDVPYTDAVKGLAVLAPKYDKAEDIYKACFADLNTAIASFKSAKTSTTVTTKSGSNGSIDISSLYIDGFDMSNWVKLANTIKLRMLIRLQHPSSVGGSGSTVVASLASTYATEKAALENNFLTTDFTVQPGFVAGQSGKQNPTFNSYAFNSAGTASSLTVVPTFYAVGFYNAAKLSDPGRTAVTYRSLATANQLAIQGSAVATSPNGTNWFVSSSTGASASALGIIKGAAAPQPIMLAAESYFLQAEANLVSLVGTPANAQANFNSGILASFTYLDKDQTGALGAGRVPATEVAAYQASTVALLAGGTNATSYLVNYGLATTDAQRLEAIITQKWIALNFIMSDEAWNEYRRTDYPRTTGTLNNSAGLASQYASFASVLSTSPRADKLPTRILYPASEYAVNASNAPAGISQFTTLIFWDAN